MGRDALAVVPEAAPGTGTPEPPASRGAFRALHSRPFRLYFLGQVASASGTFLQQTAIGWLVLQLTGSAVSLGLVLAAGGLPSLILGPWGGSIADRVDLRKLLIGTQAAYGLLAALLWASAAAGYASVGLVVRGRADRHGRTTPCFAVNAVSYAAVIAALSAVRPLTSNRARKGSGGVRAGLRYARSRQQLWLPLAMMSLVGLLAFNFAVVLPFFASDDFHGTGGTYGLLTTMLSAGSIAGSLGVSLVRHPRRIYLVAAALAFGVCLAGTAAAPNVPVACAALVVTGAAAFSFVTLTSTTLQLHSSQEYRGRIMALFVFGYLGTTPIGSVLTGWVSSAAGPRAALLAGAAACLLAAALAAFVRTPPNPDDALTDLS